jgi:glycosyltransferase involved in cell wall biosynthesis
VTIDPAIADTRGRAEPERVRHRPHILHVSQRPTPYGGTEKHLHALVDALAGDFDFSMLYPQQAHFVLRTRWRNAVGRGVENEIRLPGPVAAARDAFREEAGQALQIALDKFGFDAVHLHNFIGHSLAPLALLADFPGPVICSVHDLYLACPHHWLLYRNEQPCGIPNDLAVCGRCLPETRRRSREYLESFRTTVATRLDTVDRWVFASQSAADYLRRVYNIPPERIEIIPHGAVVAVEAGPRQLDEQLILNDPLRLAFVGTGWRKKGLGVANHLADSFAESSVEIHHFGALKEEASPYLGQHGPYRNDELADLLHEAGIQIVLLPGPYAETFGLVMTEALLAGRPVIGAGYGALGERIRALAVGWTIDPTDPTGVTELVANLDRCRLEVLRATRRACAVEIQTVAQTASRYAALYRGATANWT